MVTNCSTRLENHQTIEILHRVDFLRTFKNIAFSIFFEIFGIHQKPMLKWLNTHYFILTLQAKRSGTCLVHFWWLKIHDYCTLPVSMWKFKNQSVTFSNNQKHKLIKSLLNVYIVERVWLFEMRVPLPIVSPCKKYTSLFIEITCRVLIKYCFICKSMYFVCPIFLVSEQALKCKVAD